MGWFVTKRLAQAALTLLIVVTVVFLLGRVLGDPSVLLVPDDATKEDLQRIKANLGLDKPLAEQYSTYVGDLARGRLGNSLLLKGYSVGEILRPALWNSARLALFALAVAVLLGVPLGMLAAVKRNTPFDYFARTVALMGQVVPAWWLGIILIFLFSVKWQVLPSAGLGGIKHYILPGTIIGLFGMAGFARLTRSSMLEVLDSEFVKLARAKGLPMRTVLWKHALRNALIPVVTFGGLILAGLITGAVVVEVVFAWPGLGRAMYDSLGRRDFPVMQGAILIGACIVITVNFLVDLLYGWIDPRIRYT